MDIFLHDSSEVPLPPAELRIREIQVEPWPDGRRVRVYIELDPFQKRPNMELVITDAHDDEVGAANLIESMTRKIEITMHLRNPVLGGKYRLSALLSYVEPVDLSARDETSPYPELSPQLVVDQKTITFELPPSGG